MDLHDLLDDVAAELRRGDEHAARRFLHELDPDSQEGMWFDAFAASYPDRLAAARVFVHDR